MPEWALLHVSPVYFGLGVPHGDGSPVVLVPGFLTSDRYLAEMYEWLRRVGYRPYYSGIGRNIDCPDLLTRRLLLTIEQAHIETGERVRVVGHSLGGTLASAAAIRMPERVEQVITLGSPLAAADVHPLVLAAKDIVHWRIHRGTEVARPECFTDRCGCEFAASAGRPLPVAVRHTAIYSKRDNVVDWRCCLFPEEEANIEVRSTHLGFAFNARVYRAIARVLAGER